MFSGHTRSPGSAVTISGRLFRHFPRNAACGSWLPWHPAVLPERHQCNGSQWQGVRRILFQSASLPDRGIASASVVVMRYSRQSAYQRREWCQQSQGSHVIGHRCRTSSPGVPPTVGPWQHWSYPRCSVCRRDRGRACDHFYPAWTGQRGRYRLDPRSRTRPRRRCPFLNTLISYLLHATVCDFSAACEVHRQ